MSTSTIEDGRIVVAVTELVRDIDTIEHNQVFDYLSQWSFEAMLDTLARKVQQCLNGIYQIDLVAVPRV